MILEPSINCQEGMMKLFQLSNKLNEVSSTPKQRGQGMTEYIVIVALVAVAAIGVYSLLGQTIRNQTAGLAMEISGQDATTAIGNAAGTATTSQGNANASKGLSNYNADNRAAAAAP
jgi:Flp pilus assembly pilin Flp